VSKHRRRQRKVERVILVWKRDSRRIELPAGVVVSVGDVQRSEGEIRIARRERCLAPADRRLGNVEAIVRPAIQVAREGDGCATRATTDVEHPSAPLKPANGDELFEQGFADDPKASVADTLEATRGT
jgi:hypothetical protein